MMYDGNTLGYYFILTIICEYVVKCEMIDELFSNQSMVLPSNSFNDSFAGKDKPFITGVDN